VQLWTALPDRSRHVAPFFESFVPEPITVGDATVRVFVGSLAGASSPVSAFTGLVGAQVDLPPGGVVEFAVDETFEHGFIVDAGAPTVHGTVVPVDTLGFIAAGPGILRLEADDAFVRGLLIGGEPLGEPIV